MTDRAEKTEDIYESIVRLIEENQDYEAIKKIIDLEDMDGKIDLLSGLARMLARDIDNAYTKTNEITHEITHTIARSNALDVSRELSSNLTRDLDHADELVTEIAHPHRLDIAHLKALQLAGDLARDLDYADKLASETGYELTTELIGEIDHARKINSVIIGTLKILTPKSTSEAISQAETPFKGLLGLGSRLDEGKIIAFGGIETLNPQNLSMEIIPYLQALFDLQIIIDHLNGKIPSKLRIVSISQHSPVAINLDGAPDAIKLVREIVVRWRRENAKKLAELETKKLEAEIAQLEEEKQTKAAQRRQEKKLSEIELEQKRLELERIRIDNQEKLLAVEKMRLEIHQQKINMALTILSQLSPNLQETERITYIIQLIQPLGVLMESPLEITPK